MPETRSAIFAMGAFVAAASLTIWMIWDKVVSRPTLVARARMYPLWLMVAAEIASPSALSTGMLSPVSADSSSAEFPSMITPSTGTLSPGRTTNTSPIFTCSTGISCSAPSRRTVAVLGASFISPFSASVVRPLDMASSIFPIVISVTIIAAASKYRPRWPAMTASILPSAISRVIWNRISVLHPNETAEPIATSVSMFGARCARLLNPLIKNFLLMIMTIAASIICRSAIPMWLS